MITASIELIELISSVHETTNIFPHHFNHSTDLCLYTAQYNIKMSQVHEENSSSTIDKSFEWKNHKQESWEEITKIDKIHTHFQANTHILIIGQSINF